MRTISLALNSIFAALCIVTASAVVQAQTTVATTDIPRTISYQGKLTNPDGSPLLDGTYQITISLCANPDGSGKVWQDSYTTTLSRGIFNLYLGGGTAPLPDPAIMNAPLWIATRIGDSPEMFPLTPLAASPYALNISNGAITTSKLADGAVTKEKTDLDYISAIAVNGAQVTGKGTVLNIEGSDDIALSYNDATNTLRLSKPAAATKDQEKGAGVLTTPDAWNSQGDLTNGSIQIAATSSDWIGTTSTSGVPFVIKTNDEQIMLYQPNGTNTPNIVGGNVANSILATSTGSVIAGGGSTSDPNTIDDDGVVGNYATFAVIGGGLSNNVSADFGSVGGGDFNVIYSDADHGTIAGGNQNDLYGQGSTIGGGYDHTANGDYSTIGGGYFNSTSNYYSTVSGGRENNATDIGAFVGGGQLNDASSDWTTVGGGYDNNASNIGAFVGGGTLNNASDQYATIGGGYQNIASGYRSTVGGGAYHIASNSYTFIGGGAGHSASGTYSTVGGGELNSATASRSTVGGGSNNTASGANSAIPGGEFLRATNYGVSAVGFYNQPRGVVPSQPATTAIRNGINDPLFMVGNGVPATLGGATVRSNAFEVSYNGHSVVYDVNGTGVLPAGRAVIKGATYVDNIMYAWGHIAAAGGPPISDFGVGNVAHAVGTGIYTITLRMVDPQTGLATNLANAAITATLINETPGDAGACKLIYVTPIGTPAPGQFQVYVRKVSDCQGVDGAFMFHVTGR